MEPFLTTHTGSLPRPSELAELLYDREEGKPTADFDEAVHQAVELTVRRQVDGGIDVVNDGDMSKIGYATYVTPRLTGFGPPPSEIRRSRPGQSEEFPDFVPSGMSSRGATYVRSNARIGEVKLKDAESVQTELADIIDLVLRRRTGRPKRGVGQAGLDGRGRPPGSGPPQVRSSPQPHVSKSHRKPGRQPAPSVATLLTWPWRHRNCREASHQHCEKVLRSVPTVMGWR